MNAPISEALQKALDNISLDDKYTLTQGSAFMSGVQALVKLPLLQRQRDLLAGKNTAGFISGYRGSPLGTYDQSLEKAKKYLDQQHIVFQPGVNEELAATAIWGTQQLGFAPNGSQKYDGVFGIWYGKGPGVDRCSDVFKHANAAGTSRHGGVLLVAGLKGNAFASSDLGQSFQPVPVNMPVSFSDAIRRADGQLLLVNQSGALFRTSGQPDPTRTSIDSLASSGRRHGGGGGYGGGNGGGKGGGAIGHTHFVRRQLPRHAVGAVGQQSTRHFKRADRPCRHIVREPP